MMVEKRIPEEKFKAAASRKLINYDGEEVTLSSAFHNCTGSARMIAALGGGGLKSEFLTKHPDKRGAVVSEVVDERMDAVFIYDAILHDFLEKGKTEREMPLEKEARKALSQLYSIFDQNDERSRFCCKAILLLSEELGLKPVRGKRDGEGAALGR